MDPSNSTTIENNGTNSGIIVGTNTGSISFTIQEVVRIPSLVAIVVKALGSCSFDDTDIGISSTHAFKVSEKLDYNCVIKYKTIIRDYVTYFSICDSTMNIVDNSRMGAKSKILQYVHLLYLECVGDVLKRLQGQESSDIDKIRTSSDDIIDCVKSELYDIVIGSDGISMISREELSLGITCFVCYCFMMCRILEKPK